MMFLCSVRRTAVIHPPTALSGLGDGFSDCGGGDAGYVSGGGAWSRFGFASGWTAIRPVFVLRRSEWFSWLDRGGIRPGAVSAMPVAGRRRSCSSARSPIGPFRRSTIQRGPATAPLELTGAPRPSGAAARTTTGVPRPVSTPGPIGFSSITVGCSADGGPAASHGAIASPDRSRRAGRPSSPERAIRHGADPQREPMQSARMSRHHPSRRRVA